MGTNDSLTGYLTIPLVVDGVKSYNELIDLPSIEGVTLLGNKTFYELFPDFLNSFSKTFYLTTEQWAEKTDLISEKNVLYVYTDYYDVNEVKIPAFKVGDGNAYLIDLPFTDAYIQTKVDAHINDSSVHVTQEEKDYWNAKTRVIQDGENLIFTH